MSSSVQANWELQQEKQREREAFRRADDALERVRQQARSERAIRSASIEAQLGQWRQLRAEFDINSEPGDGRATVTVSTDRPASLREATSDWRSDLEQDRSPMRAKARNGQNSDGNDIRSPEAEPPQTTLSGRFAPWTRREPLTMTDVDAQAIQEVRKSAIELLTAKGPDCLDTDLPELTSRVEILASLDLDRARTALRDLENRVRKSVERSRLENTYRELRSTMECLLDELAEPERSEVALRLARTANEDLSRLQPEIEEIVRDERSRLARGEVMDLLLNVLSSEFKLGEPFVDQLSEARLAVFSSSPDYALKIASHNYSNKLELVLVHRTDRGFGPDAAMRVEACQELEQIRRSMAAKGCDLTYDDLPATSERIPKVTADNWPSAPEEDNRIIESRERKFLPSPLSEEAEF